jgi:hypothetical protein
MAARQTIENTHIAMKRIGQHIKKRDAISRQDTLLNCDPKLPVIH